MKKYVSVLSIAVRGSIYKLIGIVLGMGILETGLFVRAIAAGKKLDLEQMTAADMQGFEHMIDASYIAFVFGIAFMLCYIVLLKAVGDTKGSETDYFYNRLSVGIVPRYVMWCLYGIVCMSMFAAVQIGIVYGLGQLYVHTVQSELVSPQMYFLAFYRNDFLHGLLPMANIGKWIRNFVLFLVLGTEIANYGMTHKQNVAVLSVALMVVASLGQGIRFTVLEVYILLIAIVVLGVNIWSLLKYAGKVCADGEDD